MSLTETQAMYAAIHENRPAGEMEISITDERLLGSYGGK